MKKQTLAIAFHVALGVCMLHPQTTFADDYSQSFIDCFDGSPDKRIKGCTAFIKASSNMKQYEAKFTKVAGTLTTTKNSLI